MPTSLTRSASTIADSGSNSVTRAAESRPLWVWWHLLSLDAPTVAVVWCWFLGAVFGITFSWTTLPTLALGTWCVYVADRLLDGWLSTDTAALRDRHWFYLRHRRPFIIAWLVAAVPLAYLIFFRAKPLVRADDILLCLIGVAYFFLIHGHFSRGGRTRFFPHWLPKELAVGFLFAIATAVPTLVAVTAKGGLLLAAILTFGAGCWLNCVAIQVWEDAEADREVIHTILAGPQQQKFATHPRGLTEFLGRHLMAFAISLGVVSLGLTAATAGGHFYPLFASIALSAALFLALIRYSHRFSALSLRIAADTALLTPLIFLVLMR